MSVFAFTLAVPRAPERHGPQSETLHRAGPAAHADVDVGCRRLPGQALEGQPPGERPAGSRSGRARREKVPVAPTRTPVGFGTSCAALSRAVKPVLAALSAPCPATPQPVQTPAARTAGNAAALTMKRRFPTS